ncbi:MAG: aminoacyl-tRNA hydrolase [Clostridia bacterium]|nr:aminoacyl-tRNA hydrolase [Clostridia bacterium]
MENIFIVVGLGNPGNKYDNTRHNVGFDTIDYLSAKHGIRITKLKHKALSGDGTISGQRVILVKPQTYMNLSGESVREIIEWYKIPLSNIILIYDDIDLAVGKIRVRPKGSSGTHNGMRSILYHVQSEEFPRIRIGIGRPPEGWALADFVLSKFNEQDRKLINASITNAADAVEAIIKSGVEAAMNKFNK